MRLSLVPASAGSFVADVTVNGLFEAEGERPSLPRALGPQDRAVGGALASAWGRGEIRGRRKEVSILHTPQGERRIVLVGLGSRGSYSAETARRAAAEAIKGLNGKGVRTLAYRLDTFAARPVSREDAARALVDGAMLGGYEFRAYKAAPEPRIEEVTIEASAPSAGLRAAVGQQRTIDEIVNATREIANRPAAEATPEWLAEQARAIGREHHLKITVLDEKELASRGCGGILAVGGGSSHPPRMIVLEYPGRGRGAPSVAVVGKGITFDSGGISLKPGPKMSDMKFDKCGAVAVLGILRAASELRVRPRVIGIMACAENLPSGTAYRPGDVVRTYSGKTIEVLNTDAEGRVVLSDALAFAVDQYHPDALIDLATLTGAQVVALGDDTAGLISPDDRLAAQLLRASATTGEPLWRMPLTDYHRELVKSEIADVRNSLEMPLAGMLTAAAFLETFTGSATWAHLDIAGAAYTTSATRRYQPAYQNAGATAFGVRLITRYLLDLGS